MICDDEVDVTDLLEYKLEQAGYLTAVTNDPLKVMSRAREFRPDLLLLDVMMPELDGFQVCRILRADASLEHIPVIYLTARGEAEDRIRGLQAGADDYVAKPFDTRELLLRIQSIFKRVVTDGLAPEMVWTVGPIELDEAQHRATVSGQEIDLTATEFRLLHLLMERKGRVQSRENLLINVWNYEADIETRTVDTHVRRLRDKLGEASYLLETVRGVGYRINH